MHRLDDGCEVHCFGALPRQLARCANDADGGLFAASGGRSHGTAVADGTAMKGAAHAIVLAMLAGLPLFQGGCTTEQRGGRSTGQYIDDKTLNAKVRSALNSSAEYKFPDVKVETMRGAVQLSGFVGAEAQKSRAAEIARSVDGVERVENQISIKQ